MSRRACFNGAAFLSIVAAASYYSIGVIRWRAVRGMGVPSYDLYEWVYPNMLYALRSIGRGYGLWWSSFQNCGQPFFANIQNSLLYPPYLLFALIPPDAAYLALVVVNLTIGGLGAYLLCRSYGVGRSAALCGALTFEVGGIALQLASWVTTILGVYVWMPMALFACERVIARPSIRAGILLGGVLALQLLASFPQVSLFTYEILALRVVWELATRRNRAALRALAPVLLGFALAPCLAGAQLVPAFEVVATSLRGEPLTAEEKYPDVMTWEGFRGNVGERSTGPGNIFAALPVGLALLGFLVPGRRRMAAFFLLAGAFFLVLAFDTVLFRLYDQIPILNTFRDRQRFTWLVAVPLAVLVAFGADVLTHEPARPGGIHSLAIPLLLVGVAAYWLLSPSGMQVWEWSFILAVCCASATPWLPPWTASLARVLLPILVGTSFLIVAHNPYLSNLANVSEYYKHAEVFEFVRSRSTLQDRMDHVGKHGDFSLMPKIASVFEIPSVRDYEPLTSMRYADLTVMLYGTRKPQEIITRLKRLDTGESPMKSINEYTYLPELLPSNRPLLNLLAARFLVVDRDKDDPPPTIGQPLALLAEIDGVRVYENRQALPRAFYVPRLVVVDDPYRILGTLALSRFRPRHSVLVEEPPADGFYGVPRQKDQAPASGTVEILSDRGEEVVLRCVAEEAGFLFISDQYYPGWEATVNGKRTPILRANYVFRALRVPAGRSDVVFRYRPTSVRLGAGLSLSAALFAGALVFATRPRARPVASQRS